MLILTGIFIIFCLPSVGVSAEIYTDWWWNPNEAGWGVNIASENNTIFLALFLYDVDGYAHWYSGAAVASGGSFSGTLLETWGPFFGLSAFNPAQVEYYNVGTFTFSPSTFATATLSYSVYGVNVTKQIQRFNIAHIPLSGKYWGTVVVLYDNCNCWGMLANGIAQLQHLVINETVNPNGQSGTIYIDYVDWGNCVDTGTYYQFGSTYYIASTDWCICYSGGPMTFYDVKRTDEGIKGTIVIEESNTCATVMTFSAVQYY